MVDKYEVKEQFDKKELWKRILTEGKKPELQKFIEGWLSPYDQCYLQADPNMIIDKHYYHFANSRFLQVFGRQKIVKAIEEWQKKYEHLKLERPPELDNGEWFDDIGYAKDDSVFVSENFDKDGVLKTNLNDVFEFESKEDYKALRDGHKTLFNLDVD